MEPWQSWALAVGLGGAAVWYYTQGGNAKQGQARRGSAIVEQQAPQPTKRRQDKGKDAPSRSALKQDGKKRTETKTAAPQPAPAVAFTANESGVDQAQEDKEWARLLDANKKGIALTSVAQPSAKSQKQNKRKQNTTAAAKTQEFADGAATKPQSDSIPSANDVSDMLEPTSSGPSVIRLTGEGKPKKTKAAQVVPVHETKKQRQNKRKIEEQKLLREQEEKERQVLLEKQRRTAREARGEAAKNGLGAVATPASNAWSSATGQQTAKTNTPTQPAQVALLDTFEPDSLSTTSSADVQSTSTTPATAGSTVGQDLPSEEAQMEMLSNMHDWSEVSSKAKKGKKKTTSQDALVAESAAQENMRGPVLATSNNAKPSKKSIVSENGYEALLMATSYTPKENMASQDSDWAADWN